jgi:hypothetical protein
MAALYRNGATLQQIGDRYGVTRERVRQILALNGRKGWEEVIERFPDAVTDVEEG